MLPVLLLAAAATAAPLSPTSKWAINYGQAQCTISRSFGDPVRPILFGIAPGLAESDGTLLIVAAPKIADLAGSATLRGPDRTHDIALSWYAATMADGRPAIRLWPTDNDWSRVVKLLADAGSVTIDLGADRSLSFATGPLKAAFGALDTCRTSLLRDMGVDPAAVISLSDAQRGTWVDYPDYPPAALAAHERGRVTAMLLFDRTGAVTGCKVVGSSGHDRLDEGTCALLMRRAHVPPADGAAPAVRIAFFAIRWSLP
jgi:TonB family protein